MKKSRAFWMRDGKFGVMVHWCVPKTPPQFGKRIEDINKAADRFDLDRFIKDFRRTQADWLVFTIGQGSGFASPNQTFDQIAGPGHCARRDLVLEIAREVKKLGKRFMTYIHCSARIYPEHVRQGFGWNLETGDTPKAVYQPYMAFIAEYSRRYGRLVDGWWFDGASRDPSQRERMRSFLRAARTGNPDAAVALNDGSFCLGLSRPVVADQDFLAGETEFLLKGKIRYGHGHDVMTLRPTNRQKHPRGFGRAAGDCLGFVDTLPLPQPPPTCLWHALIPMDVMWEHGNPYNQEWQNPPFKWVPPKPHQMEDPLYTVDDLETVVRDFKAVGGGVTFNVGIFQEGGLGPKTVSQLAELATCLR